MNRFHPSISWDSVSDSANQESPSAGPEDRQQAGWGVESAEDSIAGCESISGLTASADFERTAARVFLLPLHYEPNYRYPLVVWLHSDGFNEHQVEHVMPHISLRNYVAVGIRGVRAADSVGHRFDWSSSPAAVEAARVAVAETVEEAATRFSLHPDRVVLAGYRSGGTMALRIALGDPDAFAGVVSLAGRLPRNGGLLGNLPALQRRRLPMLWQWARLGKRFDHQRLSDDLRAVMLMRAQVEVRQYEDDDEMNTVTLSDLNDWVMQRIVNGVGSHDTDRWSSSEVRFSNN